MESLVAQHLKSRCALVGVGNILYADDGFGPCVIHKLRNRTSLSLFDAGTSPENFIESIRRNCPSQVVVVDAVSLDAPVASLHWIKPEQLTGAEISTHGPSLDLFMQYLRQLAIPDLNILGVIPQTIQFGQPMSSLLSKTVERLTSCIARLFPVTNSIA